MGALTPSQQRSTTVFSIAISELFILLLFLAILLWMATIPADSETAAVQIPALEARVKQLEDEVGQLKRENERLRSELRKKDDQLRVLWEIYRRKPLPLTPGTPEWDREMEKWIKGIQKGHTGGRGHRNCLGFGGGPIMRITITDERMLIEPTEFTPKIPSDVAGLRELSARGMVSIDEFQKYGALILEWSEKQKPPCRFDVIFIDKANLKAPFAASLKAIDKVFYKTERRG